MWTNGDLRYDVVTPPAAYAVTLEDLKARLRMQEWDDDDADLTAVLGGVVVDIENRIGRSLIRRSYSGFLDRWPREDGGYGCIVRRLYLPRPQLVAVTRIQTFDEDNVATVMDPADYFVSTAGPKQPGSIVLQRSASWPAATRVADAIQIEWTAGYASADLIPENITDAILVLAAHQHDADPQEPEPPAVMKKLSDEYAQRLPR